MQQQLARQKVIAELDLKHEESKYMARRLPYQQAVSAVINNRYAQKAKQKELLELDKTVSEQRSAFSQALNTLQSAIAGWQAKYIARAPTAGRVIFARPLQVNQQVLIDQELLLIAPKGTVYESQLNIPQRNAGKVNPGQEVIIKFAAYPYQEFGIVRGYIRSIAEVPLKDSIFLARVTFPKGLVTSYHRQLTYKPGMTASAEIITRNSRLLERLFYQVRALVVSKN